MHSGSAIPGFGGFNSSGLALDANIVRVPLMRLEKGEQSPMFKTPKDIATALEMEATDLLVEPEFQPR